MKCKCGHPAADYILCTVTADGIADVDSEDRGYDELIDVPVDTGVSIWLHVCRGCHAILAAGIEDQGVLAEQPAEPDAELYCQKCGTYWRPKKCPNCGQTAPVG